MLNNLWWYHSSTSIPACIFLNRFLARLHCWTHSPISMIWKILWLRCFLVSFSSIFLELVKWVGVILQKCCLWFRWLSLFILCGCIHVVDWRFDLFGHLCIYNNCKLRLLFDVFSAHYLWTLGNFNFSSNIVCFQNKHSTSIPLLFTVIAFLLLVAINKFYCIFQLFYNGLFDILMDAEFEKQARELPPEIQDNFRKEVKKEYPSMRKIVYILFLRRLCK